jgi:hypothetical protein
MTTEASPAAPAAPLRAGLLPRSGRQRIWLGPSWAVLCGAVAGGAFTWQGADWLRLALLVLLAEGGWATVWAAACDEEWLDLIARWRAWRSGGPAPLLPYSQPDAPAARFAAWLGQLRAWSQAVLWPERGSALASLGLGVGLSLLVAVLLGPQLVLLTLGALAITQLAFLASGGGHTASRGAQALVLVGLAWLAGLNGFGRASLLAALLALCFAAAHAGLLLTLAADAGEHDEPAADQPAADRPAEQPAAGPLGLAAEADWSTAPGELGAVLLVLGPLAAAGLLAVTLRPLAAMIAGLAVFPSALLLLWRGAGLPGATVARAAQWPLMAAMLVAAVAVA